MTEKEKKSPGFIISENIECLAIAIAMALILKFFIIEAYKIPSGSMQPTIIGNSDTGIYDRVLVNKFVYLVSEPERWDVIVFKFPMNQSENYIKRLIGLPGEKVTIKNGDIYINGKIERKPEKVLGSVLKEVYSSGNGRGRFEDLFSTRPGCVAVSGEEVRFAEPCLATMTNIMDDYLHGYDLDYGIPRPERHKIEDDGIHHVGDLEISFEVELGAAASGVRGEIRENDRVHTFFLKAGGSAEPSFIRTSKMATESLGTNLTVWSSKKVVLQKGRTYEVAFANIDDRLSIRLDGEEIASHEYDTDRIEMGDSPNSICFGPVGGGGAFRDVTVLRDIYYINNSPEGFTEYRVKKEHYFAMGDNTQNSSDSRKWRSIELTRKDGTSLKGEFQRGKVPDDLLTPFGTRICPFVDIYGDTHYLRGIDLAKNPEFDNEHFVHEKFMLGKAMAVFWPIYPHFRWKLIR